MAKNNVNVNRSVQDPFYRYKMPRIVAKVEGKGNGIKTVIANMSEIAKSLSRPPTYPTKFFGCELGAQTNFDLKNERYIVNGDHDANKLQEILDVFIKKFVLCPACENPETILTVKRQTIHGKCKACGHAYIVDPKQKLSTFIVKNPPPSENGETEKEAKNENGSPAEDVDGEVTIENMNGRDSGSNEEDEEDWAPEPLEEDEKLSGQISKMVVDKDTDKKLEVRLDMLHQYLLVAVKDGSIQDSKKMLNEAERLEVKTKAPLLLANVLFDAKILDAKQIEHHKNLLLRFCLDDTKAQRYLLGGIEQLVQKEKDVLLKKTALIIKELYDNDICEEEVILEWEKKPSKKYASKKIVEEMIKVAQPFLKWLKEADEESEEEDDVAVAFDDRSRAAGLTVATENGKKCAKEVNGGKKDTKAANNNIAKKPETKGDDNDIDIDNI